jgi:hypothetical protein
MVGLRLTLQFGTYIMNATHSAGFDLLSEEEKNKYRSLFNKMNNISDVDSQFPRALSGAPYFYHNSGIVSEGVERGHADDNAYNSRNYYLGIKDAETANKHYSSSAEFTSIALRFAEGYTYTNGWKNFYVVLCEGRTFDKVYTVQEFNPSVVYMNENNAIKFIKWLDKFMLNGEVR